VGRERELAELAAWLEESLSERGRLVLIGGEPGIGKSRLLEEFARRAEAKGARVVGGSCWEGGGAPVYWPWIQVLRRLLPSARAIRSRATHLARLLPELRERLPDLTAAPAALLTESDVERFDLFVAVAATLREAAAERALVVTLEDLHAADRSSLLLLSFLTRENRDSRLLVAGTFRDLEAKDAPLGDLLDRLSRDGARLALLGLDRREVEDLVERTLGRRPPVAALAAIHEATAGNPLFVRELARLLASEGRLDSAGRTPSAHALAIPAGVRQAVHRRLALLSNGCRELLSAASVFGRECELAPLAESAGLDRERALALLDEAIAAGMVAEAASAPGRFAFTHGQVRETLYADLAYRRRIELHLRAGEALERRCAADLEPHLDELALHFWHAAALGNAERAIGYALRAGERASGALAHDEAAASYERALALLDRAAPDDGRCASVLLRLGEARSRAGDPEAARESFGSAASLCRRLGDARGLARAALGLGAGGFGGLWAISRTRQAELVPLLEESAAGLGAADEVLRAKVLARLATALHFAPGSERREAASREAVEAARRTQDLGALAFALSARHYALCGPERVQERLAIAEEIVALAERASDRELALEGRAWRIVDLVEFGEPARAAQEIEVYAQLAEALRQPFWLWYAVQWKAMHAALTGRLVEGERLARQALEIGRRAQEENAAHTFGVQAWVLHWLRGEIAEAVALVERMVARYPAFPGWKYTLALLYAESGREDEARRELDPAALAGDREAFHPAYAPLFLALLAETCALLGDARWAAPLYEALRSFARLFVVGGHEVNECYGSVSHYLGILAATMQRWDAASAHFDEALAANAREGARPFEARSAYEWAHALLASGREGERERASHLLARALAIARELGMQRLVGQAEALLQAAATISPEASAEPAAAAAGDRFEAREAAGTVTLVFSDMSGFTELTERLGDERALEVVQTHNAIVRREVAAHGGRELELQGDGFLLSFDAAAAALRCAIAVQRAFAAYSAAHPTRPIAVKIGIHTGEPIREGSRYFGKAVILVTRIANQARSGEILVSSVVRDLVEGACDLRFDAGHEVALEGISGKRTVFRVHWSEGEAEPLAPLVETPWEESRFRREGRYWSIAFRGETFRLKHSLGMSYLAELLRRPGERVHLKELLDAAEARSGAADRAAALRDAGEVLDARARRSYQQRLRELEEELAEAEAAADVERGLRLERERRSLVAELAGALGLGGRARRAASGAERARVSVTKAIRTAIAKIAAASPSLGHHLATTVRTGTFCSYVPDPERPPSWRL
jgi:class 3 adenylate cyclase